MNPISVTYSDDRLRPLIKEYITMQKHEFSFRGLCSWAKDDAAGLYESNQLNTSDNERLSGILRKIIGEDRVTCEVNIIVDDTKFVKTKE